MTQFEGNGLRIDYKHILPQKSLVWLSLFIISAIFFAILRLLFMINNLPLVADGKISDIFNSFWIGFRYDSMILSIVILPLFLISLIPAIRFSSKTVTKVFAIVLTVILLPMFLLSIADLRFYDNFGSRLNYWAVEYIKYPSMFLYSIVTTGGFWLLITIWIILTALYYLITKRVLNHLGRLPESHGKFKSIVVYLLMAALLVLGIRGRTGIKPLDWGEAFFSDNNFINQMSLNSIFTLGHSIYEEEESGRGIFNETGSGPSISNIESVYATVAGMLDLEPDSTNRYSMKQRISGKNDFGFYPNIVLIIMESWSADLIDALGGLYHVSPEFDKLSQRGILFDHFYANGIRTNRGIAATLCSFPSLPGRSIMMSHSADYPSRPMAKVLGDFGYLSIFAYGGDIQFDNMKGFLNLVGYDQFYEEADFGTDKELSKWGVPDNILYNELAEKIDSLPRPFNLSVMTLSYHDPYLIPDDRFKIYGDSLAESQHLNCFYFTDWALGQFMEKMQSKPVFDSTIFVFTADHVAHQSGKYPLSPRKFHIPLLIYSPALLGDSGRVVSTTGSQVDIIPTITGLLGLKITVKGWGRDLFALDNDDPGFAVITASDRLGLVADSLFMFHWIGISKSLYDLNDRPYLENDIIKKYPELADSMQQRLDSYIQLAAYLTRGKPDVEKSLKK